MKSPSLVSKLHFRRRPFTHASWTSSLSSWRPSLSNYTHTVTTGTDIVTMAAHTWILCCILKCLILHFSARQRKASLLMTSLTSRVLSMKAGNDRSSTSILLSTQRRTSGLESVASSDKRRGITGQSGCGT